MQLVHLTILPCKLTSSVVIGKCRGELIAEDVASEPVDDDDGAGDWNSHFKFPSELVQKCQDNMLDVTSTG